jgi:hypothetical protein
MNPYHDRWDDMSEEEMLRGARALIFRSILELHRAGVLAPLPLLLAAKALMDFKTTEVAN